MTTEVKPVSQRQMSACLTLALALLASCPSDHPVASAMVLHIQGAAQANHGSGFLPLAVGDKLEPAATLQTAPQSFVVLQLSNGWLTKVDGSVTLRVRELVKARAAPTTESAEQQLAALLSTDERSALPPIAELTERIAGIQQRQTAATAVPLGGRATEEKRSAAPSADERAAPASAEASNGGAPSGLAERDEERATARARDVAPAPSAAPQRGAAAAQKGQQLFDSIFVEGSLSRAAVHDVVAGLEAELGRCAAGSGAARGLNVVLQVNAQGRVTNVEVVDAGPAADAVSGCARSVLMRAVFPASAGPTRVTLPLALPQTTR